MVIKKGSLFELPKEPKLEGHRFLGWQLEGVIFEEGEKVTKNITLVAKWEKLKFTITFDSDGGSDVEKIVKDYGEKLTSLPAPTKANHGFQGWYDGTIKVEVPYTVSKDVTLKAKWGVDTHTIIFDSNGGNTIEVMTVDRNQEITELPTPTKEGFTFKGWYDGDTEVSVPLKVKKALNLVAKWETKKYTITYNLDGGTNTPENPASYTLEDEDFLLKSPTKEDYNFDGWYDEENLKVSKIYTILQKNYVLTARYSPKQYALVNPLPEGISIVNPNLSLDKLEVGTQVMFKITIPANQLVDVLRVNGNDATSTIDQNNQFKVTITPELTIAVIYVNKTHTITFNLGRNAQPMEPLLVPHRAKITSLEPPVPLYSTYTFVEWHYMGHPFDYSMPITTDMTLEAVFDIKFLFELEDTFTVSRGTVIVGKVITGTINVNDMIYDYINNREIKVLGIDKNNRQVESATAGDMIGLLLGGAITKEDASKIYSWFKMGEVQLTRKLTIEIRLLTAEEDGRTAPIFPGYISDLYIYKHNHKAKFVSFTNLDGTPASQMDPGNTYRVELEPTALSFAGVTGIEITIKEGGRVIAVGKVVAYIPE